MIDKMTYDNPFRSLHRGMMMSMCMCNRSGRV